MADAKKCDRCGSLYEIKETNFIEDMAESAKRLMIYDSFRDVCDKFESDFDVCPKCMQSFKTWWKDEKNDG